MLQSFTASAPMAAPTPMVRSLSRPFRERSVVLPCPSVARGRVPVFVSKTNRPE